MTLSLAVVQETKGIPLPSGTVNVPITWGAGGTLWNPSPEPGRDPGSGRCVNPDSDDPHSVRRGPSAPSPPLVLFTTDSALGLYVSVPPEGVPPPKSETRPPTEYAPVRAFHGPVSPLRVGRVLRPPRHPTPPDHHRGSKTPASLSETLTLRTSVFLDPRSRSGQSKHWNPFVEGKRHGVKRPDIVVQVECRCRVVTQVG